LPSVVIDLKNMGKCELAELAIGVAIGLADLVAQITAENLAKIKELLEEGIIDDENGFFNDSFQEARDAVEETDDPVLFKESLEKELKSRGDIDHCKSPSKKRKKWDFTEGSLLAQTLLIPEATILQTERWGYDREGTNASQCPVPLDLVEKRAAVQHDMETFLKNFQVVFILKQHSG
jgi:hypothetical protein